MQSKLPIPHFRYSIFKERADLFHGTYSYLPEDPRIVSAFQTHGDQIAIVDKIPETQIQADALITQRDNLFLMIKHADCQAAILFDPVTKTLATVHAGWRGLVQEIYKKTIQKMKNAFQINPKDLIVAIAPSLGVKHSEFINYKTEFPKTFWKHQTSPFYFDLRNIAQEQLLDAGIQEEHLEISPIDTFEDVTRCHSHRRNNTPHRMGTIAGINSQFLTAPNRISK